MRRVLASLLAVAALALVPAAPAAAQAAGCEVTGSSLTWGFKESFRAYIDGSIANGAWEVAQGATYETPTFGFPTGSGDLEGRPLAGQIDFPGSVRFTGHGGVLDTTIANPVLVFRGGGDDALLLLDVSGPTMDGDQVSVTATPFVTVDLSGQDLAVAPDGTITIDAAPTTLTADGEAAFPNYPAGTAFDSLSATIDVGDCAFSPAPVDDELIGVIGDATPFLVLVAVLSGLLVVVVGVLIVLAVRRRTLGA